MNGTVPGPLLRLLVLAGTADGREICSRLTHLDGVAVTASLAGVTSRPLAYDVPVRTGGFGGASGLATYLIGNRIDLLVDATHPYSSKMSSHADHAAIIARIQIVRFERPPWQPQSRDMWSVHHTIIDAVQQIPTGARVLAALGNPDRNPASMKTLAARTDVAFVLRMVTSSTSARRAANCRALIARPPFTPGSERHLLAREAITHLLCRNSGGDRAKLDAAADLRIPVMMLARPPSIDSATPRFHQLHELTGWVRHLANR